MSEFSIIKQFFEKPWPPNTTVDLGIGDDCAIVSANNVEDWVIAKDLFIENIHFFTGTPAKSIGHKSLAVNLSDLAAMGAQPLACLLGIAIPTNDPVWLAEFSKGFYELALANDCPLIGGDTTRCANNASTFSVTVLGKLPKGQALLRQNAQCHDDIWVTGELGSAAFAVKTRQNPDLMALFPEEILAMTSFRLDYPTPRLAIGRALRSIAHSAIDISDGLASDLGHILQASNLGATLQAAAIPISQHLKPYESLIVEAMDTSLLDMALSGGDDYELCFTAPRNKRQEIMFLQHQVGIPITRIGYTQNKSGLYWNHTDNSAHAPIQLSGFDHFKDPI